jgi:hypothetical protein
MEELRLVLEDTVLREEHSTDKNKASNAVSPLVLVASALLSIVDMNNPPFQETCLRHQASSIIKW